MLNTDQKIVAKILARRLSQYVSKLINKDQTGFIPKRHSFNNLRRLLNIMHSHKSQEQELSIISLDAEKAFDQVEWDYMFKVLQKFQMGESFIAWIKLLYNKPTARILTNNILSTKFQLTRGNREGCSLSPLLFALVIEPLAEKIRTHPDIYGYNTKHSNNKISLYADDVLLYITKPQISIPNILNLIEDFGSFSGYRIDWNKSEIMSIKPKDSTHLLKFPFKITTEKFKYLGIEITRNYHGMFNANYSPLLKKLNSLIKFWKTLPMSLIGRINAIKMIFLPQILYLFQSIPIYLPKFFFKKLDSDITNFIWDYKSHRIQRAHLSKPKEMGGLALPNFMYYNWAVNIKNMIHLLDNSAQQVDWIIMEREDCAPGNTGATLLSPTNLNNKHYNKNPMIHNTIRTWKQIKQNLKLRNLSLLMPIAKNPSFKPSIIDKSFTQWE